MTPEGQLVTEFQPDERIGKILDTQSPKQEFWHVGTAMAYLAVLYDAMRTRWSHTAEEAQPLLDAALALLDFESAMPLDTYLWPSKCKVGWGAGELLRMLVEHRLGDEARCWRRPTAWRSGSPCSRSWTTSCPTAAGRPCTIRLAMASRKWTTATSR